MSHVRWFGVALILAIAAGAAQAGEDKDFKRGLQASEKEDWDLAIACFNLVLKRDSENAIAWYQRGSAHFNKSHWDKAIADYSNVLRLKPKNVDAYYWRGRSYYEKSESDQAVADFNEVLRLRPKHVDAHYWRGWAYQDSRKYTLALQDYQEYVSAHPKNAEGHDALARLLATCPAAKLRDGEQALANALKACELSKYQEAWYVDTLAAAYAEKSQFKLAVKWQTKAIEMLGKKAAKEDRDDMQIRLKLYQQGRPFRISQLGGAALIACRGCQPAGACHAG